MQTAISLKNLTKKFGNITAVDGLSLEIQEGELFGFIGPNGAGKTTTIKMMTGLYRATEGVVEIAGYSLDRDPEKAKALFGYIPDEPFIYERMTGREFLYLVGSLYKIPREEIAKRLGELILLFPLEDILDEYAENYSRGNRQKLTILAALLPNPRILIIDEPIVGLDPEAARAVKKLLKDFVTQGKTVFVATHTLSFAQDICTRIGILKAGRLLEMGTFEELKKKAAAETSTLEDLYLKLVTT